MTDLDGLRAAYEVCFADDDVALIDTGAKLIAALEAENERLRARLEQVERGRIRDLSFVKKELEAERDDAVARYAHLETDAHAVVNAFYAKWTRGDLRRVIERLYERLV